MQLAEGKFYLNKRGDLLGPMEERVSGVWLDQYGGVYHPDGTVWNHVPESIANIAHEVDRDDFTTCPHCGGEGVRERPQPQRDDPGFAVRVTCEDCNGSGWVRLVDCDRCGGSGFSGRGTGYDDVCGHCGGTKRLPACR